MVCSVMTAALASVTLVLELKEHSFRRRLELFARDLKCRAAVLLRCTAIEVPRSGAGQCAKAVFLRAGRPTGHNFVHTPYHRQSAGGPGPRKNP
jgi:hypothetical protein